MKPKEKPVTVRCKRLRDARNRKCRKCGGKAWVTLAAGCPQREYLKIWPYGCGKKFVSRRWRMKCTLCGDTGCHYDFNLVPETESDARYGETIKELERKSKWKRTRRPSTMTTPAKSSR